MKATATRARLRRSISNSGRRAGEERNTPRVVLQSLAKHLLGALNTSHERVHVRRVVIDVRGRSGGRWDVQAPHQRLRAMVPRPDANSALVEHGREIVRVDAFDGEAHDTAALGQVARTVDLHAADG